VKRRIAVAAALAVTLLGSVAACGSSKDSDDPTTSASGAVDGKGKTLKVWLMVDAQSSWKGVVDSASQRFTAATGAQVNVEYQQWPNHLTKLDATLAGSDVPDVVELGNTEFPKYVFSGAFAALNKGDFENSGTWLQGLEGACLMDGKDDCVPYYAGARVLIYRTDLLQAAGVQPPKTYADLLTAADKVKAANASDPNFATFYMPGAYWYAAMAWVDGEGGQIATKGSDGKWKGTLEDAKATAGLQKWADLQKNYSKGDPTKDENDQDAIFAQGKSAFLYGNGWEAGAVQSQKKDPNDPNSANVDTVVKDKIASVPMPGSSADKGLPTFLGGSAIAVAGKSKEAALAQEWVKIFTDTKSQEGLIAKGALPNATSLLDKAAAIKGNEATALAAKNSWFVPMAPKWADVESNNVLQQTLRDIATGNKTVPVAAKWADDQIAKILNG
jgi:N,N'-diacetylchitobiose transport system substrate-binding protein